MVVGMLVRKKRDIFLTGYFGCRRAVTLEFQTKWHFLGLRQHLLLYKFAPPVLKYPRIFVLHLMIGDQRAV